MNQITSFAQIAEKAKEKITKSGKVKTALVVPSDIPALKGFIRAYTEGLIEPILIGDEELVKQKAREHSLDISDCRVIDFHEPHKAVIAAMKMAIAGEIDLIVKGKFDTADFIELLYNKDSEFLSKNLPVHVAAFKTEAYSKILFLSDGFINIAPDLKEKLAIVGQAVSVAIKVGVERPKTAVLGAVEVVYPQMQATVDAAVIGKMSERNQIKNCDVDGPLSFDVALDDYAAEAKGITESKVAGDADVLIASDVATANGIYKATSLFCNAEIGGVVVGGKVPLALNAEVDSADNRYYSILLGILAQ